MSIYDRNCSAISASLNDAHIEIVMLDSSGEMRQRRFVSALELIATPLKSRTRENRKGAHLARPLSERR